MKRFLPVVWLVCATVFGLLIAQLTRSDKLPADVHWHWTYCMAAHVSVLGIWTGAWGGFWRGAFGTRHKFFWQWNVPLAMAVIAELVQKFLPGHIPDWVGLGYSATGVAIGTVANRIMWKRLLCGSNSYLPRDKVSNVTQLPPPPHALTH
jgi:hypothetical protein